MFYSPLRYPGGKNKLSAFIAKICIENNIDGHYVEPYAGGASVALFLLIENFVSQITINDKDRSIYAFWHSVLNHTDQLCNMIEECDISIDNWYIQKSIQKRKFDIDLLDLGFSTLFLNRVNRSGIINGGVIGGIKQDSIYKMDCRFNKGDIINRIKCISKYKNNIRLLNMDALDLIDLIEIEAIDNNVIIYFDPPYYLKASSLYLNHYKKDNHTLVGNRISQIKNLKWIVSYDNVPEIQYIYNGFNKIEYSFNHSAFQTRLGKEILFLSNNISYLDSEIFNPVKFKIFNNKKSRIIKYVD